MINEIYLSNAAISSSLLEFWIQLSLIRFIIFANISTLKNFYDKYNKWTADLWILRLQNTPQIFLLLFRTTNDAKLERSGNQHLVRMKRYNHMHTPRYEFLWLNLRFQKWIWISVLSISKSKFRRFKGRMCPWILIP